MYSVGKDWRERQNINMFDLRRQNIQNFNTEAHQKEMKHAFGEDILCNLHLLQDPLKKNLADTIITGENKQNSTNRGKTFLNTTMEPPKMEQAPPTFGGITNFFAGVFNVISGAMSHWRPKSPVQYYDCFDDDSQGAPLPWHLSNNEVQNKSVRDIHSNSKTDMNIDCKTAAAQCEEKLNKVRLLLTAKTTESPKFRPRRPKKVFVEASSVEDSFEDAFSTDSDYISIADTPYIEYYSQYQIQKEDMSQTVSPKIKVENSVPCDTNIVKVLPEVLVKSEVVLKEPFSDKDQKVSEKEVVFEKKTENSNVERICREELILSCEDKLSKLKALLQEKCKKKTTRFPSPDSVPEAMVKSNDKHVKPNDKIKDKHYKNPHRRTDKRRKTHLKKSIQDDLLFAQEIDGVDLMSVENSPSVNSLDRLSDTADQIQTTVASNDSMEYFDEVSGRFRSTSMTESEDSFQIVFSDSPKESKPRRVSDCDSEDSFIVFEESPDSCYTSNDVFGESDESDCDGTDSEIDMSDTDDVQVTKLSHSMSRTLSDLTDGSLYEDNSMDEVDCAVRSVCDEIPSTEISDVSEKVSDANCELKSTGLLLNDERKILKRKLPAKSVRFSSDPPKVHVMRVWAFAARQARAGHWERCALDRDRFKRRIADVDMAVSWVLQPRHRARVMFQRFMPWWNAQKRKELAEKKAKEEEEKAKKEEEEKARIEAEQKLEENHVNGNDLVNNDECVCVNDKDVAVNDEGQKQNGIEMINNDTDKIENVKDQLNNIKINGFVEKPHVNNKSLLNDDSMKNVVINDKPNDKPNDYTSKLRSGGLSNT